MYVNILVFQQHAGNINRNYRLKTLKGYRKENQLFFIDMQKCTAKTSKI